MRNLRAEAGELVVAFRALLEELLTENAHLRSQNELYRDLLMLTQPARPPASAQPLPIFKRRCKWCGGEFETYRPAAYACEACKGGRPRRHFKTHAHPPAPPAAIAPPEPTP